MLYSRNPTIRTSFHWIREFPDGCIRFLSRNITLKFKRSISITNLTQIFEINTGKYNHIHASNIRRNTPLELSVKKERKGIYVRKFIYFAWKKLNDLSQHSFG